MVAIGVVMASYFAGFFLGGLYVQRLIARVGHIRVFAALASLVSGAALVYVLFISPVSWALMMFLTGVCISGLVVVAESWLNDMATNATRGRLLAMYMVTTMGGMTVGQFLLETADIDGFKLFVLASLLVSASLVPVTLSASSNPPLGIPEPLSTRELARNVPTGVISVFWVGTSAGVLMGLGAVYAVTVELPSSRISLFLAAPLLGSIVMQWPVGWLSDRVGRRPVMWWAAAAAGAIGVVLALVDPRVLAGDHPDVRPRRNDLLAVLADDRIHRGLAAPITADRCLGVAGADQRRGGCDRPARRGPRHGLHHNSGLLLGAGGDPRFDSGLHRMAFAVPQSCAQGAAAGLRGVPGQGLLPSPPT